MVMGGAAHRRMGGMGSRCACCILPIAYWQLLIAYWQAIAYCLLPIAYRLLPTACCLLGRRLLPSIAYSQ